MALADKLFITAFLILLSMLGMMALIMKESQTDRTSAVSIGSTVIEVEIADSPGEHAIGLSNRDSLPRESGMLFIFPQEGERVFWMKDTRIPLDIIWANSKGEIVTILHNVRPESYPQTYTSSVPAQYVLEVNAGFAKEHNIVEGMQIVI